jgi:hypothetical protein
MGFQQLTGPAMAKGGARTPWVGGSRLAGLLARFPVALLVQSA